MVADLQVAMCAQKNVMHVICARLDYKTSSYQICKMHLRLQCLKLYQYTVAIQYIANSKTEFGQNDQSNLIYLFGHHQLSMQDSS